RHPLARPSFPHDALPIFAALESRAVPCGPINAMEQVFDDAQVRARGLRIEMPHPETGSVPLVARPIRLSDPPVDYRLPPPPLGADRKSTRLNSRHVKISY